MLVLVKVMKKYTKFFEQLNHKIYEPLQKHVISILQEGQQLNSGIIDKINIIESFFKPKRRNKQANMRKLIKKNVSEFLLTKSTTKRSIFIDKSKMTLPHDLLVVEDIDDIIETLYYSDTDENTKSFWRLLNSHFDKDFRLIFNRVFRSRSNETLKIENFVVFNKILLNHPNKLTRENKRFCFEIMIKYLETLNDDLDIPLADWTDDVFSKYDQHKYFIVMQNYLTSIGCVKTIVSYIKHEEDYKVLIDVFTLANGLLLGGNADVQNALFAEISNSLEETFLERLENLINGLFTEISAFSKFSNKIAKRQLDDKLDINQDEEFLLKYVFSKNVIFESRFEEKQQKVYYTLLKYVFRFMQLASEGQFVKFQDYFSSATNNNTVNLIGTTGIWLKEIFEFGFIDDFGLVDIIFDFLIEIIQGPHIENQKMILEFKIIDICKSFIYDVGLNEKIYEEHYLRLFENKNNRSIKKIIKLFYGMLESNTNKIYIDSMKNNLDKAFFEKKLFGELTAFLTSNGIETTPTIAFEELFKKKRIYEFNEEIQNAFDYFFLSKKLDIRFDTEENSEESKSGFNFLDFYERFSTHIEIKIDGELQTVYFVIHPICKFLNKPMKDKILNDLEQKEKPERIFSLFEQINEIFLRLRHQAHLSGNSLLYLLANLPIRALFITLVLLLNLVIVFFMDSEVKENSLQPFHFSTSIAQQIFVILKTATLAVCALRLFLDALLNFRITFDSYWRKKTAAYATLLDKTSLGKQEKRVVERVNDPSLSPELAKKIIQIYLSRDDSRPANNLYISFFYYVKGVKHFILQSRFMWVNKGTMCFSFIWHVWFFQCLLLLRVLTVRSKL